MTGPDAYNTWAHLLNMLFQLASGRDSEAFVFLNHYLDLCEAIEESNLDLLDHSDFALSDFPNEIPLPMSTSIPQSLHEEVKEWVLAVSMDQKVDQVLPVDERGLYPSALCSNDSAGPMALPCVVSGYPVLAQKGHTPIEFKRPGRAANREDWNKLLMAAKMNPESHVTDVISFSFPGQTKICDISLIFDKNYTFVILGMKFLMCELVTFERVEKSICNVLIFCHQTLLPLPGNNEALMH